MSLTERIDAIFPEERCIPKACLLEGPFDQHDYLVDGELRRWDGPMQDVFSPVCVKTSSGVRPKKIGQYPLLTEKESLEVLDAAVKAYDNGRGFWTTMSVSDRIKHMEEWNERK